MRGGGETNAGGLNDIPRTFRSRRDQSSRLRNAKAGAVPEGACGGPAPGRCVRVERRHRHLFCKTHICAGAVLYGWSSAGSDRTLAAIGRLLAGVPRFPLLHSRGGGRGGCRARRILHDGGRTMARSNARDLRRGRLRPVVGLARTGSPTATAAATSRACSNHRKCARRITNEPPLALM